jgi:hypothetical protein
MKSFEEFKIKNINLNKQLLENLKPDQQLKKFDEAYKIKLHDNEGGCKYHYSENKEHIQKQQKQYREDNTGKIQQYQEDNNEQIQQRQKKYIKAKEIIHEKRKKNYEANKTKIQQNVECECRCSIQKRHLSRHMKTAKHTK